MDVAAIIISSVSIVIGGITLWLNWKIRKSL